MGRNVGFETCTVVHSIMFLDACCASEENQVTTLHA
jgi:hypothetical protein